MILPEASRNTMLGQLGSAAEDKLEQGLCGGEHHPQPALFPPGGVPARVADRTTGFLQVCHVVPVRLLLRSPPQATL